MASVMEIRGTSFPSFTIGKKGPALAKSGTLGLSLNAVNSAIANVAGGSITISGATNTTASGNGGAVSISGGASSSTAGNGGSASVAGGSGSTGNGGDANLGGGSTTSGIGGSVSITSGSGTQAGTISVTGANATGAGSSGGSINLAAGNGVSSGGDIRLIAGSNTGAGSVGSIIIGPAGSVAGSAGELRFEELVANGTNHVGLKAPDSVPANIVWTLPSSDGTSKQMLTTDGAGTMYWRSHPVPYEVYASTTIFINNTIKVVPMDTPRLVNADFSLATSVITFNRAGVYTVEFTTNARSTNTTRTTVRWDLYVDGVIYPASSVYTYHRTTTSGKSTGHRSVVVNAIVGTTVELRCKKVNGNGVRTLANDCSILIRGV